MKKIAISIILSSLLSFTSLSSMNQEQIAPQVLKVLTFNIDTNIGRTEENYARESHPQWRVGARMPKLKSSLMHILEKYSPDVIHLQEGRKFTTKFGDEVDSITPLVEFLQSFGYQVSTEQYNPSERAFSYITAIKNCFVIDNYEKFYLTQTPEVPTDHANHMDRLAEIKAHNYGEEWERCVYVTYFRDSENRRYRTRNVHLGLAELGRKKSCEMMRKNSEQVISNDPTILEVTTGDFNSFPDWGGPEQLAIMEQDGILEEVTKDLMLPNQTKIGCTFIAFPYDFAADERRLNSQSIKETGQNLTSLLSELSPLERKQKIEHLFDTECKALGGHLDRIYQYGFKNSKAILLPTPQFDDFDINNFDEKNIKDFIGKHLNDGPAFASDHQPILAILELPN